MNNNCPWCGSEKAQINLWLKDEFLTKEDFHICECLNCGLLYTMPRPSKDKIGEYYKSEEYYSHQENKKGFIPKVYEAVKKVNLKHKYRLATDGIKEGKLLDIGCGVGDFLHTAEEHGWDCTGVEPSDDAKNIARKRIKANIIASADLEQIPDATFDVITMWHVLEHVDNLKWQMEQLRAILQGTLGGLRCAKAFKPFQQADHHKDFRLSRVETDSNRKVGLGCLLHIIYERTVQASFAPINKRSVERFGVELQGEAVW